MKVTRFLASLLLLGATASVSFAQGAVSLTWNGCVGPVNIAVAGGSPVNAYVSVLGHSTVAQAYQCVTVGGSPGGPIRDAWRFDPTGCDNGFFTLNHTAPAAVSKVCPSFQGQIQSLQIKDYSFDATTGKVRITLANAYPNGGAGNPGAVNPAVRYFLANYLFDLTFATAGPTPPDLSTCGGVEVPTCWALTSATWLDNSGVETPWAVAAGFITTNDPNNAQGCPGVVPTAPRTWGSVKSQYRN
jgi:hypothetical protein